MIYQQNKPLNAIAAIRVSTTKQGTDGDSPEAQKEQIERFAMNKNICIKKYFLFMESASKEQQPMQEAINYCKGSNNDIQLFIVKSIDRFTRGGSYSYSHLKKQLEVSNVQLVDVYGIIGAQKVNTLEHLSVSYKWSVYDPTKNSEILEAERASDEKRDIMSRMIGAEIRFARLGYWMRRPPYGYRSERIETRHGKRCILLPHPKESKFIIKMYKLRARGNVSDHEIAEELNRLGYKSRTIFVRSKFDRTKIIGERGGKLMTAKRLQSIIQKSIYAGVNNEHWILGEPVKCKFEGLVSIDLFNKANHGKAYIDEATYEISNEAKAPNGTFHGIRNKNNDYPFRRMILCPYCEKALVGSANRGKIGKYYKAYHCNRNTHTFFRIPKDKLEFNVKELFSRISISPAYISQISDLVTEELNERNNILEQDKLLKADRIRELEMQVKLLINNLKYTKSDISIKYLEQDLEDVAKQIDTAKLELAAMTSRIMPSDSKIRKWVHKYLENIGNQILVGANPKLISIGPNVVFNTLPTYSELLSAIDGDRSAIDLNEMFVLSDCAN